MITESDVGAFYLGPDGNVWRLVAYSAQPTATWARVDDPDVQRGGVVGSPLAREFRRLVPESEPS